MNAYTPIDYVRMGTAMHCYVAVDARNVVGFCTLRLLDGATAEILLLYVKLTHLNRGIGTQLERFAEGLLSERHPNVRRLVLDTVVPLYNQRFYERLGFSRIGDSVCQYPGRTVRAVRLAKQI